MNRTIRTILGAGIAFGAFASPVFAQGKSHKADKAETKAVKTVQKSNGKVTKTYHKGNTTYRRTTTARARALCEDGTVVYRSSNTCANHGGLASNQGTYARYPSASARARARASSNSAVIRGIGANNVRSGAIALCNDGTYWHSTTRSNACYLHGGVARWY